MSNSSDYVKQLLATLLIMTFIGMSTEIDAVVMDNSLIGEPEIQCGSDTVEMQFRTKNMFTGKVYVKGHYGNPDCRVDYSKAHEEGKPNGGIKLNHGECDMDRQRTIRPEGMQFSTVLVISFHPLFITKIDRAFSIKCMYRELARTVKSQMEVSALTTSHLEHSFPMPICTYTIRKDEIDGAILKYARVGDQVVHRWECQTENYGLLVHSCFVEDGQGEKQLIVDERGILIGDPTYVEALNMAYRESYVFKFADRVAVRFQCEIRLCLKEDGGCNGITPPTCRDGESASKSERLTLPDSLSSSGENDGGASRIMSNSSLNGTSNNLSLTLNTGDRKARAMRHVRSATPSSARSSPSRDTIIDYRPIDADLFSQYVYVLDSVEEPKSPDFNNNRGMNRDSVLDRYFVRAPGAAAMLNGMKTVCLSSMTFGVLVGSLVVVFIAVTFMAASLCVQRIKTTTTGGGKPSAMMFAPSSIWPKS